MDEQQRAALTSRGNIWSCKVGFARNLPGQSDGPMRVAVQRAFHELTGANPEFVFSGWGSALTEPELAVVEDREPNMEGTDNALQL